MTSVRRMGQSRAGHVLLEKFFFSAVCHSFYIISELIHDSGLSRFYILNDGEEIKIDVSMRICSHGTARVRLFDANKIMAF